MRRIRQFFSFRVKLGLVLYTACILVMAVFGTMQYHYTQGILTREFEENKQLIREQALLAMRDMDVTYSLVERQYDEQIRNYLYDLRYAYEVYGEVRFPKKIEVPGLNLFCIDEKNRIEYSTDPIDLGLSFENVPDFVVFLDQVRKEGTYASDRVTLSLLSERVMRYSYLPSKDGKYIFEAGLDMEIALAGSDNVGFASIEKKLSESNDFVEYATVYNRDGISFVRDEMGKLGHITDVDLPYLKKAMQSGTTIERIEYHEASEWHHQYIPYYIAGAVGTNQVDVIEIIYSNKSLRADQVASQKNLVISLAFGLVLCAIGSMVCAKYISHPIETMTKAIQAVAAGDYLVKTHIKTGDELEVLSLSFDEMVRTVSDLREEDYAKQMDLENALAENQRHYYETVRVLANAIEAKDQYTGGHCDRVKDYAIKIGMAMNLTESQIQKLIYGSLLHDVGKIGIPEAILLKVGKFTNEEYDEMKKHPQIGANILQANPFLSECERMIYEHHERYDGNGYPQGLKGTNIDIYARIISVADSYDAMTSARPYRNIPLTKEQAIEELKVNSGKQFDPVIVDIFIACLEKEA